MEEDLSEFMEMLGLHIDPILNEAGEYVVYQLSFSVKDLCNTPGISLELMQELYDEEFPMKVQYVALQKYYSKLTEKYEGSDEEDSLDCLE